MLYGFELGIKKYLMRTDKDKAVIFLGKPRPQRAYPPFM